MFDSPIDRAACIAGYYRRRHGWNPLPSRTDRKAPLGCYAEYWDTPVESILFRHWPSPNIQLMCGVRWNLAVVDLDSPAALDTWQALTLYRPCPRTWCVRTGSGGLHLYYRIPGLIKELPSKLIWDGGRHHTGIELLADRKLVVAPPSLHVGTGREYRFLVGPRELAEPSLLPAWLARMPDVRQRPEPSSEYRSPSDCPRWTVGNLTTFDRRSVLAAIKDKLGLVRHWGLRVIGFQPNRSGWLACRALNRPDLEPSAGFHPRSGYYCEPGVIRMSLFDLAVHLRVYSDWTTAVNDLGFRYGVK